MKAEPMGKQRNGFFLLSLQPPKFPSVPHSLDFLMVTLSISGWAPVLLGSCARGPEYVCLTLSSDHRNVFIMSGSQVLEDG